MYSTLVFTISSLLLATHAVAVPLEPRNPGSAYCAPYNLGSSKNVSVSTDSSGKYSWDFAKSDQDFVNVRRVKHLNSTNTFALSASSTSREQYHFKTNVVNGTQYCLAANGPASLINAPCDSVFSTFTLSCRSCGNTGYGETCSIENTAFGTCAEIQSPYSKEGVSLGPCNTLPGGTPSGSNQVGNQVWFINPNNHH
ncbi:hypothetical protein JCM11491_000913 [Sporobolomyces phaffii]